MLPLMQPLDKLTMPAQSADSLHPLLALQSQNINIANAGVSVIKMKTTRFSGRFSVSDCGVQ
jgi:cobalt-zinc-cadmium resistance protein CzcA